MQAGWRVSAAFFDTKTKGTQGTPSFAMTMELLDNGLPRRLEMDLGGFVVVQALREAVESIQKEAFRRIIAEVKQSPDGMAALREAVGDPWVYSVLQFHGLLKPPQPSVEERIEQALEAVRPRLKSHEGNVELVAFVAAELPAASSPGAPIDRLSLLKQVREATVEETIGDLPLADFTDPFDPAGQPLRAKPTDDGVLFYSVGYNGTDAEFCKYITTEAGVAAVPSEFT